MENLIIENIYEKKIKNLKSVKNSSSQDKFQFDNNKLIDNNKDNFSNYLIWKNIGSIMKNYDLFNDINSINIFNGSINNNNLILSFKVLCDYGEGIIIKNNFIFKKANISGIYGIYLNINGIWKLIILNDIFPCIEKNNQNSWIFSNNTNNEIWSLLLEKAFATVYSNYYCLLNFSIISGIRDLTGAPYLIKTKFKWKNLKNYFNKNYLLIWSILNIYENINITVYFRILDLIEIEEFKNDKILKIKLIDNMNKINKYFLYEIEILDKDINKHFNNDLENSKTFYIRLKNFYNKIKNITIFMINKNYFHNSIEFLQNTSGILKLFIYKKTHLFISLNQFDKLFYSLSHKYNYYRLYLVKIYFNELKIINYMVCNDKNFNLEETVEEGEYLILIQQYNINNYENSYSISTYSNQIVDLESININYYNNIENLIWENYILENNMIINNFNKINDYNNDNYKLEYYISNISKNLFKQSFIFINSFWNKSEKNLKVYFSIINKNYNYFNLKKNKNNYYCFNINPFQNKIILLDINPLDFNENQDLSIKIEFIKIIDKKKDTNLETFEFINKILSIKKVYKDDIKYLRTKNSINDCCKVF